MCLSYAAGEAFNLTQGTFGWPAGSFLHAHRTYSSVLGPSFHRLATKYEISNSQQFPSNSCPACSLQLLFMDMNGI